MAIKNTSNGWTLVYEVTLDQLMGLLAPLAVTQSCGASGLLIHKTRALGVFVHNRSRSLQRTISLAADMMISNVRGGFGPINPYKHVCGY